VSPTPHAAALALGPTFAGARAPARSTAIDVGAGHLPALDGLRGLAVLAVIAFHLCAVPIASGAAWRLAGGVASVGWLGVELFFVLSGCLITGILLDTRDGARPLATFWARRALRIAPLYFALLAVAFVLIPTLVPALRQSHPRFLDAAPWYATFLTNVALARSHGMAAFGTGHLWSLAIEEQFYLVWPLVVLRATPRALARVTLALFGLGVLARAALRLTGVTDAYETYVLTPTHLDGLLAGALLALARRRSSAS
jgi:peptidoglycan/LPS O-acetylase OafA/YrhL